MVENINENDIKKYYEFLHHKNQTEIRAIKPKWITGERIPISIFISDVNELMKEIKKINGKYNIYIGINERKDKGKEDKDVEFITNIGHDIDAHGKGDEGLILAGKIAFDMKEECIKHGYEEPLIISSGHGFWVLHHVSPIENTETNVKKIKEFGNTIKKKYEVFPIEIDSTVYNPSRISRVPGTLNISEENNPILSSIMNEPSFIEDEKLKEDILKIELPEYKSSISYVRNNNQGICSFMDYCLTHEIPKGERHKTISRNMAIYISEHPDRELLKQQYIKIQKGSEGELDNWLNGIDKEGKDKFPFSIGELVTFTKKYKIPFDWKITPEYQQWINEKKAEKKLAKEIEKEKNPENFNKAIKFFSDKINLANQFLEIQPLYYDKNKLWWIWDNKNFRWELCDETDIMNYISNSSTANTINSKEKNEILEALKQTARLKKPENMKPTWIQFKNKIYDIKTGESFNVTSDYFVTNPIPYKTHNGNYESTPVMDKIFEEWVGKEYIQTLYEIIAYSLLPDYPIHRMFCFIGSGMNGKSKFLELLRKFIGENNCCSTELDTLISSRFEITRLHKKLVCQMGETNFNEMSKTSIIKKLTGGDLIGFEYKNKNPFEEKNYAKIIIATNNLPTTTDKTIGFYRRWLIIDFPNQFSEQKDILKDIPEEEYECLALKCTSILHDLIKNRQFTNEGSIEERMERYEAKSDFLQKFLDEFTKQEPNADITKSDFHKKFSSWCHENRHRQMAENTLGKKMKEKGIETGRRYVDWLYEGKGGQIWVWEGIKWGD